MYVIHLVHSFWDNIGQKGRRDGLCYRLCSVFLIEDGSKYPMALWGSGGSDIEPSFCEGLCEECYRNV